MHNRIFQLSKDKPVPREEYIDESDFYDSWFVGYIADYVSDYVNLDEDIRMLDTQGLVLVPEERKLIIRDKEAYFASNFQQFKKTLEEFYKANITLTGFSNEGCPEMHSLEWLYEDKYGIYVFIKDHDDDWVEPLDRFLRHAENGDVYYIGGVVDYHY